MPNDGAQDPALHEAVMRHFEEAQSPDAPESERTLKSIQADIRRKIEFRLALTDDELQMVLDLEKKLVIDPQELKKEFELIRQKKAEGATNDEIDELLQTHSRFARLGSHMYANTMNVMKEVREKGWVIMAGIWDNGMNFHPVGFNYGLHSMPEGTKEGDHFHILSKDTIKAHAREKDKIIPEKTAFNWRTGILEEIDADILRTAGITVPEDMKTVSLRRLGIASTLKYLITSIARKNGKKALYFNIGTIYDVDSEARLRNTPSFRHNIRYFQDDLGYRDESTFINLNEKKVGEVLWRVRGDEVDDVLRNLQSEKSVLSTRNWDIAELERIARVMYDQLNADGHFGGSES